MKQKLGTLVITKEMFVKVINALKEQNDHDDKCVDAFNVILPEDRVIGYSNSILVVMLQDLLELSFKDNTEHSWIEYFIYELDFGRKYTKGCASYKNGRDIDLSSAEALYEYLIEK